MLIDKALYDLYNTVNKSFAESQTAEYISNMFSNTFNWK